MNSVEKIQYATKEESAVSNVDGWLFTDFAGRDGLTKSLLQLSADNFTTRRWVYVVLPHEFPLKILHSIEPHALDNLPGEYLYYSSQKELQGILSRFAGKTLATLWDSDISVISTVDGGFISLLQNLGIKVTSAASLIQRTKGLLTAAGIASHERASSLLYKIVADTWNFISYHYKTKKPLTEIAVVTYILEQFVKYNLKTNASPIVAFGKNSGNPHYAPTASQCAVAQEGDIIQLDIWAKERLADDGSGVIREDVPIYGDISWVGVFGTKASPEAEKMFTDLCAARDVVYNAITESLQTHTKITGKELDLKVRARLQEDGYGQYIMHRTGHGIDTEDHGSGVNLDGTEFPDARYLLPGSCFSVEPGIYTPQYGMRTEINIYMDLEGKPIISGRKFMHPDIKGISIPQSTLLTVQD